MKRVRIHKPRTLRRPVKVLLGLAVVVLGLAGIVAYGYVRYVSVVRYTAQDGRVTVSVGTVNGLGTVLVTNKGYALYMFPPDRASRVTCTGGCASAWPPLKLHAGQTVAAGAGVRAACWERHRTRTAAASSPITAGRCTPTSAMPRPVTRPARARTTTAGPGT